MIQFNLANAQRRKASSHLALPSVLKLYSLCGGRGVLRPASQDTEVKAAATAVQGGSFRSTRPQKGPAKSRGMCFFHSVLLEIGNVSASLGTGVSPPSINLIKASQKAAAWSEIGALVMEIR